MPCVTPSYRIMAASGDVESEIRRSGRIVAYSSNPLLPRTSSLVRHTNPARVYHRRFSAS